MRSIRICPQFRQRVRRRPIEAECEAFRGVARSWFEDRREDVPYAVSQRRSRPRHNRDMAEPRRRFLSALLVAPPVVAAGFVVSPWPVNRLVEHELLPAGAIPPYAAVADLLDGSAVGDAWTWWLDRACDGHF